MKLEVRKLNAWFGPKHALQDVSLGVDPHSVLAIIGLSGCGKSTFVRCINRMHELVPSAQLAGEVLLDGEDIYDPSRRLIDARRSIGMVFQKPNPFPAMSIRENMLAGLRLTGTKASRSEKDDLVEECLIKGGLWKEVNDRLDAPGGSLSGGQQQRLCIARSLAIKPRVLLMDEPFSAVDEQTRRKFQEDLLRLVEAERKTFIFVTHSIEEAVYVSDRVILLQSGPGRVWRVIETRLATEGDPDEIRRSRLYLDTVDEIWRLLKQYVE